MSWYGIWRSGSIWEECGLWGWNKTETEYRKVVSIYPLESIGVSLVEEMRVVLVLMSESRMTKRTKGIITKNIKGIRRFSPSVA